MLCNEVWTLTSLELINFLGLKGGFNIELKEGKTFVRGVNEWEHGDNNGSCKTTLLYGVCWILYGRTPSGTQKRAVINRECKKCRGVLQIGPLSVKRSMSASGEQLEFTHMGMMYSSTSPSKKDYRLTHTQEELESYLGIDYHGFCNALFIGETSKTTKLLEGTDGDRAKLVTQLIPHAAELKMAADLVKQDAKDLEDKWDELSLQLENREEVLETAIQDIDMLQKSLAELDLGNSRRTSYIKTEAKRIKRELAEAKAEMNRTTSEDMKVLTTQKNSLKRHIEKLSKAVYGDRATLKRIESFKPGDLCPTCHQEVGNDQVKHLMKEIKRLETRSENRNIDLENSKMELEDVEKAMEETRKEHAKKIRAKEKIQTLKREMIILKDKAEAPETRHIRAMLKEKEDNITTLKETIKNLNKEMKKITVRLEYMKKVHYFFATKIRDFMFDQVREKLTHYANQFLKECAGERFRIDFPVTDKDKFAIQIYKFGVEAPIDTLSGGERWRLKFALCMGFRSIVMENVPNIYGFLLMDDEMGELDDKGSEMFHEMLGEYTHMLPQVILTVPRDSYIKNPDQVLTLTTGLGETEINYD